MIGTIVRAFEKKSYAFIRPDDETEDIFCHVSGFAGQRILPEGTRVEFEVGRRQNKPLGIKIRAIDAKPAFDLKEILADPVNREQARQILNTAESYSVSTSVEGMSR